MFSMFLKINAFYKKRGTISEYLNMVDTWLFTLWSLKILKRYIGIFNKQQQNYKRI